MRRLAIVLGLLAVALGGYAFAVSSVAGRTARSAEVRFGDRTVDVGGLTRDEVVSRVAGLGDELARPVQVMVGEVPTQVRPGDAGFRLETDGLARDLTARTWNPVTVVKRLVGRQEVSASPTVDKAALTDVVKGLATRVGDAKPIEGAITFSGGKAKVRPAKTGQALKVDESVKTFVDGWDSPPVKFPVQVTKPAVGPKDVSDALATTVRPALSGPLTVVVGRTKVSVPPSRFTGALTMEPKDGKLVPRLDAVKFRSAVIASSPTIAKKPSNARLEFREGRPRVVAAKNGVTLDAQTLAAKALPALTKTGSGRTVTAAPKIVSPAVPTSQISKLGVKELVSEFSVGYPYNPPRTHNIRTAVGVVDGTVVKPGKTFSLNQTLGQRTAANGYRKAAVIEGGNLVEGYGGGVSQVATTLFNGVFFAGLEDVEHHPHSLYFTRYPVGREATLAWGAKDLRFRNDSGNGIYIRMWLSGGEVRTQFWGTKIWDISSSKSSRYNIVQPVKKDSDNPRCIAQSPSEGFSITVTRSFKRGGKVVKTEKFRTRYSAEDEVTCTAPGR